MRKLQQVAPKWKLSQERVVTCSTPPSPIQLISNQEVRVKYVLVKFLRVTPNCKLSGYRELDKEEPVGFVDWNASKRDNCMM